MVCRRSSGEEEGWVEWECINFTGSHPHTNTLTLKDNKLGNLKKLICVYKTSYFLLVFFIVGVNLEQIQEQHIKCNKKIKLGYVWENCNSIP